MNADKSDASSPDGLCEQGLARYNEGRLGEAQRYYEAAIARDPGHFAALHMLGAIHGQKGEYELAVTLMDRAIAVNPNVADTHFNRGLAMTRLNRPKDELVSYEAAIALKPDYVAPHVNRGIALTRLGRIEEALASFDTALALKPDHVGALNNRGTTLHFLEREDEALACFDAATALKPDYTEAHYNRAPALLAKGDLLEGFKAHRLRWRLPSFAGAMPTLPFPLWEGESLAGKAILVHCEQGFGDSLHFIRYVRPLKGMAARVAVITRPPLLSLFKSIPGVEFTTAYDGSAFDCHVPLMCLPRLFGTTLETIPAEVPYLAVDSARAEAWRLRLADRAGRLKVGLVWAGDSRKRNPEDQAMDRRRSVRLEQLAPLARSCEVQFVSLQKGEPAEQAGRPPSGMRLIDPTADLRDFADTAALVVNLDLVISVDTAVAHLAGALARPVWVLSRFGGCWRWLNGREDSPWYPTARIFHQKTTGAWAEVVERVAEDLVRVSSAG